VCPDHEQYEEVQARLQEAFEQHLRGYVHEEEVKTNAQAIEEWDNQ
jgi:predicted RNase H-like HicB family nuclease